MKLSKFVEFQLLAGNVAYECVPTENVPHVYYQMSYQLSRTIRIIFEYRIVNNKAAWVSGRMTTKAGSSANMSCDEFLGFVS